MKANQLHRSTMRLGKKFGLILCAVLPLVMAQNIPVISQESEGGHGGGGERQVVTNQTLGLTNARTAAIVLNLGNAISECNLLPQEYQADCLAQNFRETSKIVKASGYRSVNTELDSAAQQISQLIEQNLDASAPKLKLGKKTYRAVKKSAVAAINQKSAAIVTETSTKLLRSTGNSALKKVHFARIAKAVNSTKVLLRSA